MPDFIVLKPHPVSNEMVDIYSREGTCPWASVHIDLFWNKDNNNLHDTLYKDGKSVLVEMKWSVIDREIDQK